MASVPRPDTSEIHQDNGAEHPQRRRDGRCDTARAARDSERVEQVAYSGSAFVPSQYGPRLAFSARPAAA
jgi:hypothetical protein